MNALDYKSYVGAWRGQSCFIVGGGPSLRNFNWRRLRNENVIAINKAYSVLPFADVLFWMDELFFREHIAGLMAHKARWKISVSPLFLKNENRCEMGITFLDCDGLHGMTADPYKLTTGKNSGYAAINLAVHFGVKRIVLLGYDMKEDQGRSHWHDGYSYNYRPRKLIEFKKWFPLLVEPLKNKNVEILNACEDSLLECFPKISIDEALSEKVNS